MYRPDLNWKGPHPRAYEKRPDSWDPERQWIYQARAEMLTPPHLALSTCSTVTPQNQHMSPGAVPDCCGEKSGEPYSVPNLLSSCIPCMLCAGQNVGGAATETLDMC